jgi:oligoendopeptidase F
VTLNMLQDSRPGGSPQGGGQALTKTFKDNMRTFTLITNTLAKDKEISDRWRGFEDIADSRHLANRVEREVVDALAAAVQEAYPRLSHRYYAMKAKWLGMEQMEFWDRNAPLPETPTTHDPWTKPRTPCCLPMAASSRRWPISPSASSTSAGSMRRCVPARRRARSHIRPCPRRIPMCWSTIMGKPRDVMTLAHELGHGVHQVLAGGQGALMASTPLTLAETASVFGEMLTFRALLDKTKDKRERKAMLAQKVEDMINTVVRQIAFYEFERKVHTARKNGELTADDIGELWLSVQEESLGPAIRISEGYETYWAYIPHFIHSPFYVYAYAFGDCLVNSLYAVYQNAERASSRSISSC